MIAKARIILVLWSAHVLLSSSIANTSVKLAWDPSPDQVAGYKMYWAPTNSSQFSTLTLGNVTNAVVDNLVPGTTYSFYVTAYRTNNTESLPSNTLTYTTSSQTNPSSFIGADTSTHGSWHGIFGADGSWVAGASPNIPSYVNVTTIAPQWLWNQNPISAYAPYRQATGTNRIAACWYSPTQLNFSFNINDGQLHRMAMYFLDWTGSGRQERVELVDLATGGVLDAQTLTNFSSGMYLIWQVTGNVGVRVTPYNMNAVVSGIFFDPPSANLDSFAGGDTTTHGNWHGAFGSDGNWVAGASPNIPSYATVSTSAPQWLWDPNPYSANAPYLQPTGTNRIAACWYSANQLNFSFAINDGQPHRMAMYFLDWTGSGRQQRVDLIDSATGGVLDTQNLTNFSNGVYLVWEVAGNVGIRITPYNVNAVVSAIFFDPMPSTA